MWRTKKDDGMRFSEVMRGVVRSGDRWSVEVGEDWAQGRSLFGGLQAALAVRAMRDLRSIDAPLRSLQVAFLAPVPPGAVSLHGRVLRTGKNVQQIEARLVAGEDTLCLAIGVYGAARTSRVAALPTQPAVPAGARIAMPRLPGITPENAPSALPAPLRLPFVPGLTPNFTQHFGVRWLQGSLPLSGSGETRQILELDLLDDGGDPLDETHVLAFADFIPPIALNLLTTPANGSSLTWMVEFLRDRYHDLALNDWRVDAELLAARDGYLNQSVSLWAPDGTPAALGHQSMTIFD